MRGSHLHARTYKSYEEDELTGLANLVHFRNELAIMIGDPQTESVAALVVFSNVEDGHNAARMGFTGIMHL